MKNKDGQLIPKDIAHLITRGSLSKREGIILAEWYLEETGEDKMNCMCSNSQRIQIRNVIRHYLDYKPTNKQ